jgi:hypothetical protein
MGEGAHCFRHWRCWCHPNRAAPALRRALADLIDSTRDTRVPGDGRDPRWRGQ